MTTRRQFLQTTAATGIGFWLTAGLHAKDLKSPNERIGMAAAGFGGKGQSDFTDAGRHGDMVAVCDVDEHKLDAASRAFPKAKRYVDYRKMLDEMGGSIDAVVVSTPDHAHAVIAATAMRMGKHCFCQKPMTHSLYEARTLANIARQMKVATQMGNQGTADGSLRKGAAMIREGLLGAVSEVHVWTDRPIWAQGGARPAAKAAPESLHWDLWLGPAPVRPFGDGYHPFAWRGWWDFGCGALGDMGCHTMNMPFMALDLRDPISVQAETSGHNHDSYPSSSKITYEFAARGKRPAVKMYWYDGGKVPALELFEGGAPGKSGALFVGEKGKMLTGGDYGGNPRFLGNVQAPDKVKYPHSPGHFEEWIRAIRGGQPAMSNFPNYAGPLTETVLLGNLAVWVAASGKGEKVEWDARSLTAKNVAGLEPIIHPTYRAGYSL